MKVPRQRKNSAMDASIGVNLRVTAHSNQGGRKYMEDMFCVAYQPTSDEKDLLYAYFGIFDGHGGREAALYAKTHLMDHIVSQKNFWSDEDELVLRAIRDGFISVHQAMWRELDKWPKTQSGLPTTSGTTASVAFVRRGKLYIGHVGDSAIVLGYQDPQSNYWKARSLTRDHKPESPAEHARIQECGGKVVSKSGVPRVAWNRPRIVHKGPVRRSTLIDEIPFLAVARSLGDLWSYNSEQDEFVVSPVPNCSVIEIDVNSHRCLILGSDGLWNMLSSQDAVNSVYFAEKSNEHHQQLAIAQGTAGPNSTKNWINPSKRLVDRALDKWYVNNLRADNTSVVTVVIDPPGPPRVQKQITPQPVGPRYTAVYTKYPVSKRSPTSEPSSNSPATPPNSRSAPTINQSKAGDRINRKKKPVPKISSKTSRVLLRHPHNVESSPNQSREPALISPSSSRTATDTTPSKDSDVQINEISSSCESFVKSETVDASSSSSITGTSEPKRGRGRPPSSSAKAASSTLLKRTCRQSGPTEDESVSQRKIMKLANESAGKLALGRRQDRPLGRLRSGSRKPYGKLAVPKKTIIKPGRLTSATRVKDERKTPERIIGSVSTPSRSTRATPARDPPLSELLTDNLSDVVKVEEDTPSERLEQPASTVAVAESKPSSVTTSKASRSIRGHKKLIESQQNSRQMMTRGKRQQGLSERKCRNVTVTAVNGARKKQALMERRVLNTSLPADFTYFGTPVEKSVVPKPILKRLKKGYDIAFQNQDEKFFGTRGVKGSNKRFGKTATGAARGRVTRSMMK